MAYDGKPYDPDGWAQPATVESQIFGIDAPGFYPWLMSGVRHDLFDKLSGVLKPHRSRNDEIQTNVFEKLHAKLRSVEAEKAHYAQPQVLRARRRHHDARFAELFGSAPERYRTAQKAIVQVERAITDDILMLGIAREVVAMQPLGFLKFLHTPYVTAETLAKMDAHWGALKAERNSWSKGYEAALYA